MSVVLSSEPATVVSTSSLLAVPSSPSPPTAAAPSVPDGVSAPTVPAPPSEDPVWPNGVPVQPPTRTATSTTATAAYGCLIARFEAEFGKKRHPSIIRDGFVNWHELPAGAR
ncbi:hypothetical protein BRC78_04990 [Halobacteriales archaeon QH_8_68_33]|nr:MAG: hypothetical protein BRC78_04990 [Halobacteriales archaeon QH_8_68_33]